MHKHAEKASSLLARTGNKALSDKHADMHQDAKMIAKAVHEHEHAMHKGEKETKIKLKEGGCVEGGMAKGHLARRARGGSTPGKKGTHVNVIVAPQGGGGMHPPGAMPPGQPMAPPRPPMSPPPGAGQPMMPPRPAGPPPGAGMPPPGGGMPPPGGGMRPPGMMKRGGNVQTTLEKGEPSESLLQAKRGGRAEKRDNGGYTGMPGGPPMMPPGAQTPQSMAMRQQQGLPMQKRGGRTERAKGGHVPHMEAGAGGAEGRIEKMHEYGEGGFKPKEHYK